MCGESMAYLMLLSVKELNYIITFKGCISCPSPVCATLIVPAAQCAF